MSREMDAYQRELGERIKSVRLRSGLSQADFAARIGFSQPTIWRIEAGTRIPDAQMLKAIVEEFDCGVTWLLLGTDDQKT